MSNPIHEEMDTVSLDSNEYLLHGNREYEDTLEIDNIKDKINFLIDLGYSKQEVLKMTINFPALYSFSEENIIEKIEYYRKKNLDFIIIENTKYLMQSMKKTKARYNYLTEEKMFSLDESNYSKLFMSEKNFQKTYGVSTDALIRMYGLNPQIID